MDTNRRGFLSAFLALPFVPSFLRPQQVIAFDAKSVCASGDVSAMTAHREGWITVADNAVNLNERRYGEQDLVKICESATFTFVHSSHQKWEHEKGFGMDARTVVGCVQESRLVYATGEIPGPTILQIKVKWLRDTPRGYYITPTSHGNYDPITGEISNTKLDHFVVSASSAFRHASSI